MSDTSESTFPTYHFSFENKQNTEITIGFEPLGLYYELPIGKVIEIVYTPFNDYKQTFYFGENNMITLDTMSADMTVYLDGEEVYP